MAFDSARPPSLSEKVIEAWEWYERHGEISHLDGVPLIYAGVLEELYDLAMKEKNNG